MANWREAFERPTDVNHSSALQKQSSLREAFEWPTDVRSYSKALLQDSVLKNAMRKSFFLSDREWFPAASFICLTIWYFRKCGKSKSSK